ncbi:MAG: hypothetical protein KF881_01570 [Acidobacteria bacterium]|nr:hypothetical protein [Acidobacteriota bacterium]
MGCDFHWKGKATEEQQRLCGWFLESLFDADENGVSRYFAEFMKCETYSGEYTGLFFEVGPPEDRGPFVQTIQLSGTTIRSGYFEDREPGYRLWATDQLSFVFMKIGEDLGELITVEPVADTAELRYGRVREKFQSCGAEPNTPMMIFRRRGQDRLLANESWLANLLYATKRQFMPMLKVSDDYLFFADIAERGLMDQHFSRTVLKPELAGKWGFGLDEVDTILSGLDAFFEKSQNKYWGLSDAALAILKRAEVFSLSDLTYKKKDSFVSRAKPTPEVLNEIEEAMLSLGYSFEPGRSSWLSID